MGSKSRPVSLTKESTTCISDIATYTVRLDSSYCLLCPLSIVYSKLVLALSKRNTNAAEVIIFLHRLSSVLVEYFKELEEESIRDNFVIIYELMDEMMDFGYPQTTESKILQE